MPKILSSTPAWLCRPSPGHELFAPPSSRGRPSALKAPAAGPRRTLARRGTEVFVAVGTQIRWADLASLKNDWEEKAEQRKARGHRRRHRESQKGSDVMEDDETASYRSLKVPVSEPIRQLIPSPKGHLLAIVTSHTVHVALLPDSSHLGGPDTGPIRLKTHTLGPTTHVLSQPPVTSALWHPLGVSDSCLVTVTTDAVVRVWELNPDNRWSFDSPSMALDLKKLVDGTSSDQDFGATNLGKNKGFSPDSFDMEVASTCFGGTGNGKEEGWAPMTLWLAMREGDVYALCPLLPTKWQPPPALIPSLSVSIVSDFNAVRSTSSASAREVLDCQQRYAWISEIDNQEPAYLPGQSEFDPEIEVFTRPIIQGAIPRLQGPFLLDPAPDDGDDDHEVLFTDIHVIGAKLDEEELMFGEDPMLASENGDGDGEAEDGVSVGIVCLITSTGRVHVCLDVDGVEGAWLPTKKSKLKKQDETRDPPTLLTFESIDTQRASEMRSPEDCWPVFSPDPYSRYSLFATHRQAVTFLSFSPWIERLESELSSSGDAGLDFRMKIFTGDGRTLRERVAEVKLPEPEGDDLTASVVFRDSDLGYFLLTEACGQAVGVSFDLPEVNAFQGLANQGRVTWEHERAVVPHKSRAIYQPPSTLWAPSPLASLLDSRAHGRQRRSLTEEIRLSQATLILMTEAHKVLSQHTYQLGVAAAELFRRCERLQGEFHEQIKRADEVAGRIDAVLGEDFDEGDEPSAEKRTGNVGLESRIEAARVRQEELGARYDRLRRRLARSGGRELSEREVRWMEEVEELSGVVAGNTPSDNGREREEAEAGAEAEMKMQPWQRFQEVYSRLPSARSQRNTDERGHEGESTSDGTPQASVVTDASSGAGVFTNAVFYPTISISIALSSTSPTSSYQHQHVHRPPIHASARARTSADTNAHAHSHA
ncbi:MAG: hypothetical protein M1838_001298 [Thelocarpon superellum]|nr:MAG: hypothetical protein M1838_001298 [Thelocarpon superellum]